MGDKGICIENQLLVPVHLGFTVEDDELVITVKSGVCQNYVRVEPGETVLYDDLVVIRACSRWTVRSKRRRNMRYIFRNRTGLPLMVVAGKDLCRNDDGPIYRLADGRS